MNCRETQALLSDYIECQLPNDKASAVKSHLAGCGDCRSEHEDLQRMLGIFHALPREEPVFELWQEFAPSFAAIQGEMKLGPFRLFFVRIIHAIRDGWNIFVNVVMANRELDNSY